MWGEEGNAKWIFYLYSLFLFQSKEEAVTRVIFSWQQLILLQVKKYSVAREAFVYRTHAKFSVGWSGDHMIQLSQWNQKKAKKSQRDSGRHILQLTRKITDAKVIIYYSSQAICSQLSKTFETRDAIEKMASILQKPTKCTWLEQKNLSATKSKYRWWKVRWPFLSFFLSLSLSLFLSMKTFALVMTFVTLNHSLSQVCCQLP